MDDLAIRVEGLGKRFRLGEVQPTNLTLIDTLSAPARRWANRLLPWRESPDGAGRDSTFWALRDVTFDVERGSVLGVIGPNGAGKTTLLKILSRITDPTEGRAEIRGRVGSLIELGAGFHGELTGRENIFLNGSILGMTQAEIRDRFEEIVAFAEVEDFLDTPVKRYSTGMTVRLAFAVAAHLEPEILLVDEVLAVGDLAFQRKSVGKMRDVASSGRTVLFVSHSMAAVSLLCDRAIMIDHGGIRMDGETAEVLSFYQQQALGSGPDSSGVWRRSESGSGGDVDIDRIEMLEPERGLAKQRLTCGEAVTFRLYYRARSGYHTATVTFGIFTPDGVPLLRYNTQTDRYPVSIAEGEGYIDCVFAAFPLNTGSYAIDASIAHPGDGGKREVRGTSPLRPGRFGELEVSPNYDGRGSRPYDSTLSPVQAEHHWIGDKEVDVRGVD